MLKKKAMFICLHSTGGSDKVVNTFLFKKAVAFFNTLLDSLIILFTTLHVLKCAILFTNFGSALGKGRQAAKTEIEKLKLYELTCREGIVEVAKIIYGVHTGAKDKSLSWVCDESNRQQEKVPSDLVKQGKAALEEMDAD
ncbi:proteasome subunit alpha type-3-like [Lolium rigidum]|uniref:proteasome subunit alpha type-3-like n=1 Tax=Lolium rigidum TaxID=89674 RepID=UPI001F5DA9FA|nr:proteasome subunit alpha type-3-like [Lolium rigidum]